MPYLGASLSTWRGDGCAWCPRLTGPFRPVLCFFGIPALLVLASEGVGNGWPCCCCFGGCPVHAAASCEGALSVERMPPQRHPIVWRGGKMMVGGEGEETWRHAPSRESFRCWSRELSRYGAARRPRPPPIQDTKAQPTLPEFYGRPHAASIFCKGHKLLTFQGWLWNKSRLRGRICGRRVWCCKDRPEKTSGVLGHRAQLLGVDE